MKHFATIQVEFLKTASWDNLSIEEQKDYLKQHPKSKKRITARPKDLISPSDVWGRDKNKVKFINEYEAKNALKKLQENSKNNLVEIDEKNPTILKFINDAQRTVALNNLDKNFIVHNKK